MTKRDSGDSTFDHTDEFVDDYDNSARKYGWHTPEVLFGLMFEHLESGQTVLDLGIGTGLSAVPFAKAGLEVCGIDGSPKMLDRCAARGITADLKQHDICSVPIPYRDDSFDHVVACGVFHLLGELGGVFSEVARVMRGGGIFAFSVELFVPERVSEGTLVQNGLLEMRNEKSGVRSYLHGHSLMEQLLANAGFTIGKTLDHVAFGKTDWADERSFRAYVARKKEVQD